MAKILKLNRKTVNSYYNEFRRLILEYSLSEQEKELGEFELDESHFGARRVRGKRGRGASWEDTGFRAFKKKREGICNGRPELLSRRVNADYSGKNSRGINDSHRWLESL